MLRKSDLLAIYYFGTWSKIWRRFWRSELYSGGKKSWLHLRQIIFRTYSKIGYCKIFNWV